MTDTQEILEGIDFDRLSARTRWAVENVLLPMREGDLTQEAIAEQLGIPRRRVAEYEDQLRREVLAQRNGAELADVSHDEYDTLRESIRQHGQLDPLVYAPDGTLLDGHQRERVLQELALEPLSYTLPALATSNRAAALALNLVRRGLSTAQKKRAVEAELIFDADRSDRLIAATVGVSHPFVAKVRKELEAAGDVEATSTRVDALGRKQRVDRDGRPVDPEWTTISIYSPPPVEKIVLDELDRLREAFDFEHDFQALEVMAVNSSQTPLQQMIGAEA